MLEPARMRKSAHMLCPPWAASNSAVLWVKVRVLSARLPWGIDTSYLHTSVNPWVAAWNATHSVAE